MNILEIIEQNFYIVAIVVVAIIISIVYTIGRASSIKKNSTNFLEQHPDAAKIYLAGKTSITSEKMEVFSVDGEKPVLFVEGLKNGFYVLPGRSSAAIRYTYTRPGVLHSSVSKTTDTVTQELETEAKKAYELGFDRKANTFTLQEI